MATGPSGRLAETDAVAVRILHRRDQPAPADVRDLLLRLDLDMLRSRTSRREEPLGAHLPEPIASRASGVDPEHEALLADAVGPALLLVLDALSPAERLAFVLHAMFAVPFDEIARIVGCSPVAARQRARRRVQGRPPLPTTKTRPTARASRPRAPPPARPDAPRLTGKSRSVHDERAHLRR